MRNTRNAAVIGAVLEEEGLILIGALAGSLICRNGLPIPRKSPVDAFKRCRK